MNIDDLIKEIRYNPISGFIIVLVTWFTDEFTVGDNVKFNGNEYKVRGLRNRVSIDDEVYFNQLVLN